MKIELLTIVDREAIIRGRKEHAKGDFVTLQEVQRQMIEDRLPVIEL